MATIQQTQNFPPDAIVTPPPPGRNPYARRGGGIPVPPMPPANDPNMLQTDMPADPLSPTTLILNYLKSRGYQPNAENIRRAVEANARDPGVLGADPVAGLRNARASTDAEDQAAMRAAGAGRGGGGAAPGLVREEGTWDTPGGKTSSAPPAAQPTLPTPAMMPRVFDQLSDVSPPVTLGRPQLSLPPPEGPSGGGGGGGSGGGPLRIPPPDPLTNAIDTAVPRLPPPPVAPPAAQPGVPVVPEPPAAPLALPAPPPVQVPPNPRVTTEVMPPPVQTPSTLGSRALENFKAGGGVRGAIGGGGGARGGVGRNFIPGLGGAIMLGTGAKDIYDEWMRQHSGQTPPAS